MVDRVWFKKIRPLRPYRDKRDGARTGIFREGDLWTTEVKSSSPWCLLYLKSSIIQNADFESRTQRAANARGKHLAGLINKSVYQPREFH
jgi:hypothetical protein